MWKRIPMLLLLVAPYATLYAFGNVEIHWLLLCAGYMMILLGNAVYAFFLPRLGFRSDQILFWDMFLKLGHAILYLSIFILSWWLTFLMGPYVLLITVAEYMLLLSTSMFGVSGLWKACRGGELTIRAVIVHAVLHFFFCLDVISAVICYIKIRRVRKQNRTLPEASAAE